MWEIPVTGSRLWAFHLGAQRSVTSQNGASQCLRYPIHSSGARNTQCRLRRSLFDDRVRGYRYRQGVTVIGDKSSMRANSCPSIFVCLFFSHRCWRWRWRWRWRLGSIERPGIAVIIWWWWWWWWWWRRQRRQTDR
ncbi:hypothetical protein BDR03DRAFT_373761 [Suillus americanus]|nr:hypothetical protein BDR03DRAFT_373761 [Suillus americanus]